jgi:hypothetical protein
MKKFIVPVLSICFFMSCSTDAALNTVETTTTDSASDKNITKKSLVTPENPENEFDFIGKINTEILKDCEENYATSTNLYQVLANVETTALNNADFIEIDQGYVGLEPDRVQWVAENAASPNKMIENSAMSPAGKALFMDFMIMLDGISNLPYNQVYDSIVSYEDYIANASGLNAADSQIILIAASTARYALADNDGRLWKKSKGSISASASTLNVAESITMSVAVNILTE